MGHRKGLEAVTVVIEMALRRSGDDGDHTTSAMPCGFASRSDGGQHLDLEPG